MHNHASTAIPPACLTLSVPHTPQPIVKVDRLSCRLPAGGLVLSEISFTIGFRERVGLIGPNGAGKSTLLLHLNGLLPHVFPAPFRPEVEVLGLPLSPTTLHEIRRQVGLLFQDPGDQLFCRTVAEDVAFGPQMLGFPPEEVRRRVRTTLINVGLTRYDFATRDIQELSHGQKKLVSLAGLLACEPEFLALDEPAGNLSPRLRRNVINILRELPVAQLVASHDLELIREVCSRVMILDQGRLQAEGATDQILADESLMHAHGLEVPASLRSG